jgi:hypothetical protein
MLPLVSFKSRLNRLVACNVSGLAAADQILMCLSVSPIARRLLGLSSNEARAFLRTFRFQSQLLMNYRGKSNCRYNPHFGSIHNILLNDGNMHETLTLTVLDHNEHRKDSVLGVASFDLALLAEDATHEGIVAKIFHEGKDCGELVFNV